MALSMVAAAIPLFALSVVWWIWRQRVHLAFAFKVPGHFPIPYVGCAYWLWLYVTRQDKLYTLRELGKYYNGTCYIWERNLILFLFRPEDVASFFLTSTHTKPPCITEYWSSAFGEGLLTTSSIDFNWRIHRKIILTSMTVNAVKVYFQDVHKHSIAITDDMKSLLNKGFQSYEAVINRYTANLVSDSMFRTSLDFRNGQRDELFEAIHKIDSVILGKYVYPWYNINFIYKRSSLKKATDHARRVIDKHMSEMIQLKNNNEDKYASTEHKDFDKRTVDVLSSAHAENVMSEEEFLGETANMWITAADTLSTAIKCCILSLAIHKPCQDRVFAEIERLYQNDRDRTVSFEDLAALPYLNMCLQETLRLFAPGPFGLRYTAQDTYLKSRDITIPAGVDVIIPQQVIHRDPKYWENPNDFVPERFAPENLHKIDPNAYLPFSGGKRRCPGKAYALAVVQASLVYALRKFEFHNDWDFQRLPLEYGFNTRCSLGFWAEVKERNWCC